MVSVHLTAVNAPFFTVVDHSPIKCASTSWNVSYNDGLQVSHARTSKMTSLGPLESSYYFESSDSFLELLRNVVAHLGYFYSYKAKNL